MKNILEEYKYSKQFILVEDLSKKIKKKLTSDEDLLDLEDYLYSVVTSVTQKNKNGITYHLIQHEDKELGWLNLEDSIRIYRFQSRHYKIIEENFKNNDLNKLMGIDKDFISHFKGKLLNIKSQISYENEVYYSVFIKGKFHGFHNSKDLDALIEVNMELDKSHYDHLNFYTTSSIEKNVNIEYEIENLKLVSIFKRNLIGKVVINSNVTCWIDLKQLKGIDFTDIHEKRKVEQEILLDDLIYSINVERNKSKEIIKTVLDAKNYLNKKSLKSKDIEKQHLRSSFLNARDRYDGLKEEAEEIKNENKHLKNELRKSLNEKKLAENRLTHQLDYKVRLEKQRDKYKERMSVVEEKLKNLDDKYKKLKEKNISIKK